MTAAVEVEERLPIRLVVRDDELRRSRLTVFFRLLLFVPHLVWLGLWGFAANVVAFVLWLAILIEGRAPTSLHDFVAGYVRYATQAGAYLLLAADPYPGFRGAPGYPVDVEIDPPARQRRLSALFRAVLALPALLLAATLGGGLAWGSVGALFTFGIAILYSGSGVAGTAAFLAWFAALVTGRAPRGLRDLTAYALGYNAQATGYLLLLTGRYPSSDVVHVAPHPDLPQHPVTAVVTDDLGRSRLTVFFRLLLAVPHFVWLTLWTVPALAAAVAAWLSALFAGRVPGSLHRFLAAYVRCWAHIGAFVTLVGRRFPGFVGREGSYEIDVRIEPPARQARAKTLLRLVLAVPALLLASALGSVLWVVAFVGWWYALVLGRMPEGLRNLGASCVRYNAQTYAYVFLLTSRYPYGTPGLEGRPEPEPLPVPEPLPGDVF